MARSIHCPNYFIVPLECCKCDLQNLLSVHVQGWSYVGDRLLSAVIPYEETGWYDGQMWVKPPEVSAVYQL